MTARTDVETVCAPEWVEFDAYASRTARGFWSMGEVLARIRAKSRGSFQWGLEQRGLRLSTAYNWIKLHESMTIEEAGRYPSLRSALLAVKLMNEPETSNALDTETAGQSADGPIQGDLLLVPDKATEYLDDGSEVHQTCGLEHCESYDADCDAQHGVTESPDVGKDLSDELAAQDDTKALPPSLQHHEPDGYDYDAKDDAANERQLRPPSRKHPATYSGALFPVFAEFVKAEWQRSDAKPRPLSILDPMAGEGSIRHLPSAIPPGGHQLQVTGVELDIHASDITKWHYALDEVIVMDATDLQYPDGTFDMVITSPAYANRMADKISIDGDNRVTYADRRGHDATANDVSGLSWGNSYRLVMATIWNECVRVTRPGGLILLNSKDHVRQGGLVPVTEFHILTLLRLGCTFESLRQVETYGVKGLANDEFRAAAELVIGLRKASG